MKDDCRTRDTKGWALRIGANPYAEGGTEFRVWGPRTQELKVKLISDVQTQHYQMAQEEDGYYSVRIKEAKPGMRYFYELNRAFERPDPASRYQPESVHGPSMIIDPQFAWTDDNWTGLLLRDMIIYELHVGTFTPEGTFDGVVSRLPYLRQLGINCIEIMPVGQFPGKRNWGYDGVEIFAVQNSYGGPAALKRLVNECHLAGIAVCLDVVYNHLGPEGNYLDNFGPYFTDKYHTPWGRALNYDDRGSDSVRSFIIDNACYWVHEYHIDALRLDAIHGIYDFSAVHLLEELSARVKAVGRLCHKEVMIIAESDLNDVKVVRARSQFGYGLDSQWSDDFHHSVHAYLTGERIGYYGDYGTLRHIEDSISRAFVYNGRRSNYRSRRHGNSADGYPGERFVICTQNHDQIGNRALGERLNHLIPFEEQKIAACMLLLSPYVPLLFMGQEWSESSPFQYFVDHGDPHLMQAVREGRNREFREFGFKQVADPGDSETFKRTRLHWDEKEAGRPQQMQLLYQDLIRIRKQIGLLWQTGREHILVKSDEESGWLAVRYLEKSNSWGWLVYFRESPINVQWPFEGQFYPVLDTELRRFGGKAEELPRADLDGIMLNAKSGVVGRIE